MFIWPIRVKCGTTGAIVGRWIVTGLLGSALAGCSSPAVAPDSAGLEDRVRSWWAARQAGDAKRMYEMLEPSFRQSQSFAEFQTHVQRLTRIQVQNLRISTTEPVPNSDRVMVVLVGQIRLPRTGQMTDIVIHDPWVRENGGWWRVYVPPRTPFEQT